jgi:hypothetical protein
MGNCCGANPSTTPGELILVQRDSANKCVFENAYSLVAGKGPVALTLKSHPGHAITSLGNAYIKYGAYGVNIRNDLGVGPAEDALLVMAVKTNPSIHLESLGGHFIVNDWDQKLFEVELKTFRNGISVHRANGFIDSIGYKTKGREFAINSDGTISPSGVPNLVLGLNAGWQPVVAPASKRDFLLNIGQSWPRFIACETGVNSSGQNTIARLKFVYEPIRELGSELVGPVAQRTTRCPPFLLKAGEAIVGVDGFIRSGTSEIVKIRFWTSAGRSSPWLGNDAGGASASTPFHVRVSATNPIVGIERNNLLNAALRNGSVPLAEGFARLRGGFSTVLVRAKTIWNLTVINPPRSPTVSIPCFYFLDPIFLQQTHALQFPHCALLLLL